MVQVRIAVRYMFKASILAMVRARASNSFRIAPLLLFDSALENSENFANFSVQHRFLEARSPLHFLKLVL